MDLTLECIRRHYAGDLGERPAVHIGGGDGGGVLAAWSVGSCSRHRCIMRPLVGPPCFQSGYSTQHCAIAYAAYPEPMTADGNSKRTLAGRVKAVYENLPLPPAVVAAMALDLLLARLRPLPLPGHRSVHRMAGAGLVAAGVGLNVWALAERRRRSAGTFDLERPEVLVDSGPYAITRHPMYVGWWLIQLGAGSLAGSSWALALLPAELLVEHRYVLKEEAALARLFPQSYPAYAEEVPRYLGLPRT